jgi:hypothetical protein
VRHRRVFGRPGDAPSSYGGTVGPKECSPPAGSSIPLRRSRNADIEAVFKAYIEELERNRLRRGVVSAQFGSVARRVL